MHSKGKFHEWIACAKALDEKNFKEIDALDEKNVSVKDATVMESSKEAKMPDMEEKNASGKDAMEPSKVTKVHTKEPESSKVAKMPGMNASGQHAMEMEHRTTALIHYIEGLYC